MVTAIATSDEAYLLQDLVLFNLKPNQTIIEGIKARWKQILRGQCDKTPDEIISGLQPKADRLGHRINVAEVLAHAQA